jgi:hypothetical protein
MSSGNESQDFPLAFGQAFEARAHESARRHGGAPLTINPQRIAQYFD